MSYKKQKLLALCEYIWVHPGFFGGVCVAHLFSFICWFFFFLCSVSCAQMLPVPLDWPFLIVHSAFSNVYLKLNCMLLEKTKGAIKNGQFREI